MKAYLAADGRAEHEIVIHRSRFIATAQFVKDFEEAAAFVAEIKKKYSDATHNCYAFISNAAGTEQRFSDDGEPQGTAGMPILEVLKKRGLKCTAAVVTRYFGGVKLGAGGLVSAYTQSAAEALDKIKTVCFRYSRVLEFECPYNSYNGLQQLFKSGNFKVLSADFDNSVKIRMAVPVEDAADAEAKINDALSGQADIKCVFEDYCKYDNE